MDRFACHLGQSAEGPLHISKAARDVHMQVIGLSGQGKSSFLEHMIRQDIENGAGVCLIDPHGGVYDNLVDWLAAKNMHLKRHIHLINPAMGDWSVGFNPLARGSADISTRVGTMIEACEHVWGDDASSGHKTLGKLLDLVFSTIAAKQLSIREALLLTTEQNRAIRQGLVDSIGDPDLSMLWDEVDALRPSERVMRFEAVHNRLRDLIRTPVIRSMLGQTDDLLDFKTCMEEGDIVLVNLEHRGRMKPQVAKMLGTLITAELFFSALSRERDEAKEQPFYCYIDECGDYVNETVAKGLDETRKYGLHYVLSHQRMSHLGDKPSDPIRNAVVASAQSKIVFLQDEPASADELGEFLFGKKFDFEKAKESLIKPTVVGYERETFTAEGYSEGAGFHSASGAGVGIGLTTSHSDIDNPMLHLSNSETESNFDSSGESYSRSKSFSEHEGLVPIFEDRPTATFSREELKHMAANEVRGLQARQAFAYRADDRQAIQFATSDIFPVLPKGDQNKDFYATVRRLDPSANRTDDVEASIIQRHQSLLAVDYIDDDDHWHSSS